MFNDRYTVKHFLGSGTYGSVYFGEDNTTKKAVAIKYTAEADSEACIMSMVSGRHAPDLFDWGDNVDVVEDSYLITEFIPYHLYDIRVDDYVMVELCYQLMQALVDMHDDGVTHSDLHSNNVMVDDAGVVRIIDYGCSFEGDEPDYDLFGFWTVFSDLYARLSHETIDWEEIENFLGEEEEFEPVYRFFKTMRSQFGTSENTVKDAIVPK